TVLGAFGLGYAVTTLIGGFAVDRYGARLVLTVAALLWSLSIGATALASSFVVLYAARVLLGVSEGPNFPALTGAVSHWPWPQAHVLKALLTNRTLLANTWAFFVFGYFLFFFMTWLPSYLERVYGLSLNTVGLFTVLPWLAAALVLGLMGRWSDHLLKTTG